MNKKKIILDFEDFLNSYKNKNSVDTSIKRFFPISLYDPITEEYAYLIGKIMGDGNLDKVFTTRFIGKEHDLEVLRDLIIEKFKISGANCSIRMRISKGVSYLLQINYASFGRLLYLLGAPVGNKTKTSFKIPDWIMLRKSLKKKFLQALLEDELTTIKIEKCNYSVKPRLKLAKIEELLPNLRGFMKQVKEAIESFGVECSHISKPIKSDKTQELYFFINRNKRNIIKFKEEIGFRFNQNKIEKLDECYKIIKDSLN